MQKNEVQLVSVLIKKQPRGYHEVNAGFEKHESGFKNAIQMQKRSYLTPWIAILCTNDE